MNLRPLPVKQELADVDLDEVERLLAEIEAEVKPQIMPFYYCDGPNGEKGTWTHKPTGKVMGPDLDPLALKPEERKDYDYEGPEIIYTFWAKHGPCQVTGCGHRTPIMTNPVMAIKTISVKSWEHVCASCGIDFEIEAAAARMAPDVPLYIAPDEKPYSILDPKGHVICPSCGHTSMVKLGKGKNKKVELTLLVHPEWLAGSPRADAQGKAFGGSPQDDAASTAVWNAERARHIRLLEVRGGLPERVTCPETKATFATGKEGGTVPKRSTFTCASCGTQQDVMNATRDSQRGGQVAGYAIQGFAPKRATTNALYNGRFFAPIHQRLAEQYSAAVEEWERRKDGDLELYWPKSEVPYGFIDAWSCAEALFQREYDNAIDPARIKASRLTAEIGTGADVTVSDCCDEYFEYVGSGESPRAKSSKSAVQHYKAAIATTPEKPNGISHLLLRDLTARIIIKWRRKRSKSRSPSTVSRAVGTLRAAIRYFLEHHADDDLKGVFSYDKVKSALKTVRHETTVCAIAPELVQPMLSTRPEPRR